MQNQQARGFTPEFVNDSTCCSALDKNQKSTKFLPGAYPLTRKDNTTTVKETMMIDENLARIRAHRNNIQRYRRLLATRLSDLERAYVEKRPPVWRNR